MIPPNDLNIKDTELAQLSAALEYSEGFALYFVVCNISADYQPLTENLRTTCSKPISTFTIPDSLDELLDVWLTKQIKNVPDNGIIFLYGLETLLAAKDQQDYLLRHNILQQLNWQRNAYQRLQRSLVLWLPEYAMQLVARYASDFYDWRTAVFEFKSPEPLRQDLIQESLQGFKQGWSAISGMTLVEKQRWLQVLKGLIAELEESNTEADQLILAKLLNDEGELYYALADYNLAKPSYERALAIRLRILGEQHPDCASSLNNLAQLYERQGDYEQALPLYQQTLEIIKKTLGEEHPDFASSLNNLARLYSLQGNYEQALPLCQQALEITRKTLGEEHPDFANSLNNLAGLYYSQGDYEQALPLYQQALAITKKMLGEEHPHFATSLNNLAGLYREQGNYEQALPLHQQALEIIKKVLGKEHPDFAISLNNLAGLYDSQGDYEQAKPLYEQSLEILRKALGEEHPNTQIVKGNYQRLLEEISKKSS